MPVWPPLFLPVTRKAAAVIRRFIDVGIAVSDLAAAVERYSAVLGTAPRMLGPADYAYPGLTGARFYLPNATISLVASRDPQSTIARFIRRRGEGVNHLTLEVTDLEEAIPALAARGLRFLTPGPLEFPEGRVIFAHPGPLHGVQVAFVQPHHGADLLRPPGAGPSPEGGSHLQHK